MDKLIAKAAIQIQKPVQVVFESIIDPDKITQYFIGSSSGHIEEGADLVWTFPEFDEECAVKINAVQPNQLIEFIWDPETVVRIALTEQADKSTLVRVTEDGKTNTAENLKWLTGNTEGWANFLACLKAFSEYNINLRKGAFDYVKNR